MNERRADQQEILGKLNKAISENEEQDTVLAELKTEIEKLTNFIENHMDWEEAHQKLVLKVMSSISFVAIGLISWILIAILGITNKASVTETKVGIHKENIVLIGVKQEEILKILYSLNSTRANEERVKTDLEDF